MSNEDKNLTSTVAGFTVAEVGRLLGMSDSAVHQRRLPQLGSERGAKYERESVVAAHREKLADLEEKLRGLRLAAADLGVGTPAEPSSTAQPVEQAQPVDKGATSDGLRDELARLRTESALQQQEIDRLKMEIQRSRGMIDGLQTAISAARPMGDFLDAVPDARSAPDS